MIRRLAGFAVAISLIVGCAPRESAVDAGNRPQTLHLGNSDDPPDFDPLPNISSSASRIVSALNEGLVNLANDGGAINQAANEGDRRATILKCECLINAEAPRAPLFITTSNRLVPPSVNGLRTNPSSPSTGPRSSSAPTNDSRARNYFTQIGVTPAPPAPSLS